MPAAITLGAAHFSRLETEIQLPLRRAVRREREPRREMSRGGVIRPFDHLNGRDHLALLRRAHCPQRGIRGMLARRVDPHCREDRRARLLARLAHSVPVWSEVLWNDADGFRQLLQRGLPNLRRHPFPHCLAGYRFGAITTAPNGGSVNATDCGYPSNGDGSVVSVSNSPYPLPPHAHRRWRAVASDTVEGEDVGDDVAKIVAIFHDAHEQRDFEADENAHHDDQRVKDDAKPCVKANASISSAEEKPPITPRRSSIQMKR